MVARESPVKRVRTDFDISRANRMLAVITWSGGRCAADSPGRSDSAAEHGRRDLAPSQCVGLPGAGVNLHTGHHVWSATTQSYATARRSTRGVAPHRDLGDGRARYVASPAGEEMTSRRQNLSPEIGMRCSSMSTSASGGGGLPARLNGEQVAASESRGSLRPGRPLHAFIR